MPEFDNSSEFSIFLSEFGPLLLAEDSLKIESNRKWYFYRGPAGWNSMKSVKNLKKGLETPQYLVSRELANFGPLNFGSQLFWRRVQGELLVVIALRAAALRAKTLQLYGYYIVRCTL